MTPDAVPPPPPNRFWKRRDPAGGGRTKPAVQRAVLFLLALAVVAGGVTYKFGWFPFDDRNRLRAELLADVVERSKVPVAAVEITGDGTAVATLPDGEKLAVRWARADGALRSVCQRPKAEVELGLRLSMGKQFGPVRSMALGPSPVGVGYVGEALLESGVLYDVFETTDLDEMACHQWVWQSAKNYLGPARRLLEKAVGGTVTDVAESVAGDFPARSPDGEARLCTARMRTAGGWYVVELYQECPPDRDPNGVWGEAKVRHRELGK